DLGVYRAFLAQRGQRIGDCGAIELDSDHQFASADRVRGWRGDLCDAALPVRLRILRQVARIEFDGVAFGSFGAPDRERHFIARDPAQTLAFQCPENAFAGDLLPPTAGLLI